MTKKEYFDFLKLKNLSDETARTYYLRLRYYLKNKNSGFKDKDKSYMNQIKQAVKYYFQAQDIYYNDDTIYLDKLHDKAKKRRNKPEGILYLKKVNQKINLIEKKELRKKVAFRLQEVSGLRISEIADLETRDIEFLDNYRLKLIVRHGKGDKRRVIKCISDKYVWAMLKILRPRKNGKIFHAASTLMKKAKDLDFKSHRLRKVFADQINLKFEGSNEDRKELLQKALGHETGRDSRTYKKYIDTNINYDGTKFDI
ncbi:MAG: site-specific integrase [Bacteroidales bacterium]|nr:site-specific integrase [Bacteroidales bacterium]